MSKYNNKKVMLDGIVFDSKREATRFAELKLLERAGQISKLELQKTFELIPAQYEKASDYYKIGAKKGQLKKGKLIEKAVTYKADFCYWKDGKWIVEDTKGVRTREYIVKRKLMLYVHGIRIREI